MGSVSPINDNQRPYHYREWVDGRYEITEYAHSQDVQLAMLNSLGSKTLQENKLIWGPPGQSCKGTNAVTTRPNKWTTCLFWGVAIVGTLVVYGGFFMLGRYGG